MYLSDAQDNWKSLVHAVVWGSSYSQYYRGLVILDGVETNNQS